MYGRTAYCLLFQTSTWSMTFCFSSSFLDCLFPLSSPSFRTHSTYPYILNATHTFSFSIFLLSSSTMRLLALCIRILTVPCVGLDGVNSKIDIDQYGWVYSICDTIVFSFQSQTKHGKAMNLILFLNWQFDTGCCLLMCWRLTIWSWNIGGKQYYSCCYKNVIFSLGMCDLVLNFHSNQSWI